MADGEARTGRTIDNSWVHAELRGLHSPDVDDLSAFAPDEAFNVFIEATIGLKGEPGAEEFSFTVCSPLWLCSDVERHDVISRRHLLFMKEYNYDALLRYIHKCLAHATDRNWNEVALKLARWSHWEFEDYDDKVQTI